MRFILGTLLFPATFDELKSGQKMLACRPGSYRKVLDRLLQAARVLDEGGFEGISFSEQHANVESAVESNTNPIMLDLFVAAHTKRLKVGQLGMVLSANHPWRIAEDIALLDQMSGGRAFCGFSRGNATRWVNMFAQHFNIEAAQSDKGDSDERNMRAVKEAWSIIKAAWTSDLVNIQGEFWRVPAPDTKWTFTPTRTLGGGLDENGILTAIGAVPRPVQQPHPRVFAPLAFRMTTAKFWVGEGGTAVCYTERNDFMQTAHRVLSEELPADGKRRYPVLAPGCVLIMAKTREEAQKLREDTEWLFNYAYGVPPFNVPMGRVLFGTPDDVSRQIEELTKIIPFEDMFVRAELGLHDPKVDIGMLELFCEKVVPRFQ